MYGKVELQYNRARQASRTRVMLGAMGSEYAVILMHDCSQKFVRENGALKILLQSKKIATCYFPAPNIPKHQLIV